MAEITARQVSELREATGVGMMECKRALEEAGGDREKALRLLRERGLATAQKKAGRATNQGAIGAAVSADGKTAALVEINCETDFVARNDQFKAFVAEMARRALETDAALAETARDVLTAMIQKTGENMQIRRNLRLRAQGEGRMVHYVHLGDKEAVLIELGCQRAETAARPEFWELGRDLAMHVSALAPRWLQRTEVPEDVLSSEREIYAKQVVGKPANIVDKIVEGKIQKFFSEVCFVDQPFVKEPKISVAQLLAARGKEWNDTLSIRRYLRWVLGE
jgi:elongation factor Ts